MFSTLDPPPLSSPELRSRLLSWAWSSSRSTLSAPPPSLSASSSPVSTLCRFPPPNNYTTSSLNRKWEEKDEFPTRHVNLSLHSVFPALYFSIKGFCNPGINEQDIFCVLTFSINYVIILISCLERWWTWSRCTGWWPSTASPTPGCTSPSTGTCSVWADSGEAATQTLRCELR